MLPIVSCKNELFLSDAVSSSDKDAHTHSFAEYGKFPYGCIYKRDYGYLVQIEIEKFMRKREQYRII
jgi:hypothetical protein